MTAVLGAVASAALFVFVVRAGHHVHFSAPAFGSSSGGGSDPSLSSPDDLGAAQGPISLNGEALGDGGSEAD